MQRASTVQLEITGVGAAAKRGCGRLRDWLRLRLPNRGEATVTRALSEENARLRAELDQLREAVERTSRLSALGVLAASIAHEIRNPLVSVCTFFQLAPERWHDEEFSRDFRALAEKELLRVSNLVTELLSLAKAPTRAKECVDVGALVARTIMLIAPKARQQRVKLASESPEPSAVVYGAEDQLKQVLINVLLNAVEATPPGGTVKIGTTELVRRGRGFCRLTVVDSGPGVSPEARENLFEPFFTTKPSGTGLGLSIARRIVAEHEGCISFESDGGGGTQFHIDLPLFDARALRRAEKVTQNG